jgi:hypothetical protein
MNPQPKTQIVPASTTFLLQQMIAASNQLPGARNTMIKRAEAVRTLASTHGLELPVLGTAPLFDGVRLINRTTPNWAVYNLSHDPLFQNGSFPVPGRDLRRLQRMYRSGIQFDAIYMAHELPPDFRPGVDELELSLFVPTPPEKATRLADRLGRTSEGIVSTCLAVAGKPFTLLTAAGATAVAVLRDPILMGTVVPAGANPDPGIPAVWFLLAAWRW